MVTPKIEHGELEILLGQLGRDLVSRLIIIGGQAVSFWAWHYNDRVPALQHELQDHLPTRDYDFCGDQESVKLAAMRLRSEAFIPQIDDQTPSSGKIIFLDHRGVKRTIDFLDEPYGVRSEDLSRLAVPIEIEGYNARFNVMHPVLCMESRLANTANLPGYQNQHSLAQTRASILCSREFLLDELARGATRDVLKLNERIFRIATNNQSGQVFEKYRIEPFDAVLLDERLPDKFQTIRYPQMRQIVTTLRERQVTII